MSVREVDGERMEGVVEQKKEERVEDRGRHDSAQWSPNGEFLPAFRIVCCRRPGWLKISPAYSKPFALWNPLLNSTRFHRCASGIPYRYHKSCFNFRYCAQYFSP